MEYQFNGDVAILAGGVDEAVFIHNLYWWIRKNEANGRHCRDGRTWTYNSVRAFCELMPFWSENQVRRIIKNLEDKGLIIIGNYNDDKYDRTRWFSLSEEVYAAYGSSEQNARMHLRESTNESVQIHKSYNEQIVNTDSKQDPPLPPKGDESEAKEKKQRFSPPSAEEVAAYCAERQNGITASEFVDHYTAKGWMVGKSKMVDWKAAVRTWERSRSKQEPPRRMLE